MQYIHIFGSIVLMEKEEQLELETELRVYEVGYLLIPYVQESEIAAEVGHIKEHIEKAGGVVFSEETPRMLALAYPMFKIFSNKKTKFENAYFGWVKFDGEPASVAKIKKSLDAEANVLRFTIMKTIRENTLIRKPSFNAKPIAKPIVKEEVKDEENKEIVDEVELDKEIAGLIIE